MILVIYSHRSHITSRTPIYSREDMDRLAEKFPIMKRWEQQENDPNVILKWLVEYLSAGHLDAHIENDGQRVETKEEFRVRKLRRALLTQSRLSKSDKLGQYFVDFPQHSANKVKTKSGWATWHFTKEDLAHILRNWDTAAHWEYRAPFKGVVAANRKHPSVRPRQQVTSPIAQHIKDNPKKAGSVLYHGAGQDKVSSEALKSVADNVDVYEPFQDPSDKADVWQRDIRTMPDKQYDEVHSHYTLNVVPKDGHMAGKSVVQELHDKLKAGGKAVISVRRDECCAPNAKPKLVESHLTKSENDKIANQVQGIVSQVKPETGAMGAKPKEGKATPYGRRFVFNEASDAGEKAVKTLDPSHLDNVKTNKINDTLYHHIGEKGNQRYHFLSSDSNPYAPAKAGLITANADGKNYLRGAFSDSTEDADLDTLRTHVNADEAHAYEAPVAIDSAKHMEKGWENHHPDLVHGLMPDKTLQAPPSSLSSWISFAGVDGDSTPRVVTKEALKHFERKGVDNKEISKRLSFFNDPHFTTAHREAAYSKMAHDVFGLGEYVPRTTVFSHPLTQTPWSAQEFLAGASPITKDTREADLKEIKNNGDIYKMALMNLIMGNNDRHLGNMLKDSAGKVKLIDHGLTFDYNDMTTGLIPKYIEDEDAGYSLLDETVPESVHKWLWDLDTTKLAQTLHAVGAPHDIVMNAVRRLVDARGWSNFLKLEGKNNPNMHKGLRHLATIMRARKFNVSADEQEKIAEQTRRRIVENERKPLGLVGRRGVPSVSEINRRLGGGRERERPRKPTKMSAENVPTQVAQDKTELLPSNDANDTMTEILPDSKKRE